jgi:hypothetical protein
MADDDILALNQLIRDYGTEYQAPERLRMPMKERLYADYTPASKTEQAEMLLSMLPGIGEGLDIAHMTKDVQEGNYGQAGLSGLAMALPGIGAGVIKKLYHGSPTSGQILPDPNKAVETKSASFLTDNEDVAYTFTLPREYGEPKFYDDFGNEIEPGSVTEIYTDIKNPFTLKGDEAQKFIDDSSYQQKVINKAKAEGFDSVIAENVYEGIGERYKNNVYAVFNKEQMTLDAPKQAISSADTSLRQVPALFKKQDIDFPEGGTNFDIGGGRFDEGTKYLADERGVENFVYDPYNRSPEHNAAVMDRMRTEAADTATAANVLNVIAEPEARADVIRQAMTNIKPGGTAYFQIYEGAGTGVGKVTSKGFQNNKKTADYIGEVEEIFGPDNVRRKGNVIIATKPVQYRRGGSVVSRDPYRRQPRTI